jgi:hypothetical protein
MRSAAAVAALLLAPGVLRSQQVQTAPGAYLGTESCVECHKPQYGVWKESKHATSLRTVHQKAVVPDILSAVGGERSMKKNQLCLQCHYTASRDEATGEEAVKSAVSCEQCHGAASGWIKVHQDFGGKPEAETAEHKANRIASSVKAGMIYPSNMLGLATKCVECHGLTKPGVDATAVAKMVHMGHPMNDDYELVRYSQGTVRHRFYPPQLAVNKEMTPEELARLYITGQAAKLVSAQQAWSRSDDAGFRRIQSRQIEEAKKALSGPATATQAAELLKRADLDAALKLISEISGQDLSRELENRLPKKKSELR